MNMNNEALIIDLFAGGGGASVGIEMALGRQVDIAVNHDSEAIRMHRTNHPHTLHLTEDVFKVDLEKYVGGRHVALLWASPDCRSFSKAKGGRPKSPKIRVLPWAVYKHARAIKPDVIIMENVEEIQQWGPLDANGFPIKERMGESYQAFIKAMQSLGYKYDSRELIAADYGAPTTRKRWYAIFRRDGKAITWPRQTHSKNGSIPGTKTWEPVWKYLNLDDYGKSIFGREKPLADKTMGRIGAGVDKFVLKNPEPFIVVVNHGGNSFRGQGLHEPLSTITARHGFGVVTPVTERIGIPGRDNLMAAFLTKFYKSGTGQSMFEPLHTITTSAGHFGQVTVLATDWETLKKNGIDRKTAEKCTWVSQFIMEYYGCGTGQALTDPMHTIVTKDRFALITVLGTKYCILDIFLRMLSPEELKLAQGFPKDYIIDRDYAWRKYPKCAQVARIGNSVVPIMAQKLVEANCGYLKVGERRPIPIMQYPAVGQIAFA